MAITVLVADDHAVVRSGLSSLLSGSDIQIVGEAANGDQAVEDTLRLKPDVVLMDIRMPQNDGLWALEKIRKKSPETRVLMLSTFDNPTYVARSAALGAVDYVLKDSTRMELIDAIHRAAQGESANGDGMMQRVKGAMSKQQMQAESDVPLTNRETQVLRHIALGLSNREIGRSLGISVETVKEHVQNVLRKINVTDRTQAAVWAVKRDLV